MGAPRREARGIRGPITGALAVLVAGACAHVESPSGGPADQEAPRVVSISPDSGAVGVLPETLSIVFSEEMNRGSVNEGLFLSPPIPIRERRWKDERLDLLLGARPDTGRTYVLHLGSAVEDRRDNSIAAWEAPFATGARLDDGVVEGTLRGGRITTAELYVYAWPWEAAAPESVGEVPPPLRLAQAGKESAFRLRFLPRSRPLRICALYDADHDRAYDAEEDLWGCLEEPVVISDTQRVAGPYDLYVVLPDEPGVLQGTAVDSSCVGRGEEALTRIDREADSLAVLLHPAAADSTGSMADTLLGFEKEEGPPLDSLAVRGRLDELRGLRASAVADSARCAPPIIVRLLQEEKVVAEGRGRGGFDFREIPPGVYRIEAFRDIDGNAEPGEGEPRGAYAFPVEVLPGRTLTELTIQLPAAP